MYRFSYRTMGGVWAVLKDSVDATFLSTKVAGGFVGCMYALYATSDGQFSGTEAAYDWFEYTGTDDVYR
jgi:alpha-N-arabinofuranosidase